MVGGGLKVPPTISDFSKTITITVSGRIEKSSQTYIYFKTPNSNYLPKIT
jgi:hypothetical protein